MLEWDGSSCLPPGDLPNPEIELTSLISPALAHRFFTTSATYTCVCVCVCVCVSPLSHVQFLVTLWAVAHQATLSIKFSQARILEWVTIPSPGDLPDPRKTKMGYFSPLFSVLGCFSSNGYHCCLGPTPTRSSPPCFLILWVNLAPEIWLHCPFL